MPHTFECFFFLKRREKDLSLGSALSTEYLGPANIIISSKHIDADNQNQRVC